MNSQFNFNPYDHRSEFDQLIDQIQVKVIGLEKDCDQLRKEAYLWLVGAAATFVLPFWLVTRHGIDAAKLPSLGLTTLSPIASLMARSAASKYAKKDRLLFEHEKYLNTLKIDHRFNERKAHNKAIKQKLDEMFGTGGQEQQTQTVMIQSQPPINPEWIAEKRTIESIFHKAGKNVTVYSKSIQGHEVHYVFGPTNGVDLDKVAKLDEEMKLQLLVNAGFPAGGGNPRIEPQVGKLVLIVNHPHIFGQPQRDVVPTEIKQPEYEPIAQSGQPQQQPLQQGGSYPEGPSFTIVPPQQQSVQQPSNLPRISDPGPADLMVPDGAVPVSIRTLNDINRYPVVMICAGQGAGKSATAGAIMQVLEGYKAVASPKPLTKKMVGFFDLAFGYNPQSKKWLFFGDMELSSFDDRADLSWHLHQVEDTGIARGSMLDFLWACRRESMNRQLGLTESLYPWRVFYDEAAYTYLTGYNDPFDVQAKAEKSAQSFISGVVKDAFMNFRGQKVQMFIGTQNESVESIGLKNFAAGIKEAWHLYPGLNAITAAEKAGKENLARWLKQQAQSGRGIALLEKEKSFYEVIIDLPLIKELDTLTDGDLFELDASTRLESPDMAEYDDRFEAQLGFDPDDVSTEDPWIEKPKTKADNPYDMIIEWIQANHSDRINDRSFPSDAQLNELLMEWFKQQGQQIQPISRSGLADLRAIVNARRGLS